MCVCVRVRVRVRVRVCVCVFVCVKHVSTGIPEYNCYINSEKTVANFQLTKDGNVEVLGNGTKVKKK